MALVNKCQVRAMRPMTPLDRPSVHLESMRTPRIASHRGSALRVFAQQRFATQLIGGGLGGANQIFVAGKNRPSERRCDARELDR